MYMEIHINLNQERTLRDMGTGPVPVFLEYILDNFSDTR